MSSKEERNKKPMPSSSREEKKLQRQEKLRQYGVDLPDIPGLPVEVIPLQVHIIKMATKLFSTKGPYQTNALYLNDEEHGTNRITSEGLSVSSTQDGALLNNIMQRIEAASSNTQSTTEEQRSLESNVLQKYQDGLQAWLNAIHRCVKDNKSKQTREASEEEEDVNVSLYSVPVAALQHLWEVGLDHKRCSVRRATQHLAGKLLERSSDCRSWWLQYHEDETIREHLGAKRRRHNKASVIVWMDHVLSSATGCDGQGRAHTLWQLEAFDLLKHLERKGYSALYPTLLSAIQRFQQNCPGSFLSVETMKDVKGSASIHTQSMAGFRFVRDIAMTHWEEMERRLQKLIQKAKRSFDVLVPRIEESIAIELNAMTKEVEDDDKEEEDIDWEDGFEDDRIENNRAFNESIQHANAVERTLEIMKNTSGMQEGRLEISIFANEEKTKDAHTSNTTDELSSRRLKYKEILDRVIRTLTIHYMPRLSDWAQALAVADNLKVKSSGKSVSIEDQNTDPLIQMTESELIQRSVVLQSCLESKQEVAHILQSVKRLGTDLQETRLVNNQKAPRPAPRARALQNSRPKIRLAGPKRMSGNRSAPLQIKFAKR